MLESILQIVGNSTGLPPITVGSLLGDMTVLLVLSAVIVGIAWRTLGKYWDKWRDGETVAFDRVFLGTAIAAFIGAITPALAIFPAASSIFATSGGSYGIAFAWIITVGWAYGVNEGINYTYKRVEGRAEKKAILNLREEYPELDKLITEKMEKLAENLKQEATNLKNEVSQTQSQTEDKPPV
jgi:hypothetical protein